MGDTAVLVLGLSLLLQIGAAAMALRLSKLTGWRATWVLLASAISLMAFRRGLTLTRVLSGDMELSPDLAAELVALAISVLMVLGINLIVDLIYTVLNPRVRLG